MSDSECAVKRKKKDEKLRTPGKKKIPWDLFIDAFIQSRRDIDRKKEERLSSKQNGKKIQVMISF